MIPQDLAAQFELYAGAAQQASNRAGTVENTHYHCGATKAYRHAARLIEECLVPRWTSQVPTKPGRYLRRFDKTSPVYMETYVLDEHGVLCYVAGPDDGVPYGSPIGPRFQATTEWCEIASPAD